MKQWKSLTIGEKNGLPEVLDDVIEDNFRKKWIYSKKKSSRFSECRGE